MPSVQPQAAAIQADPRWAAVVARDARADGTFYYSVRTTGVYCRPSCPARRPKPENVAFHPSREAAEAAGFRPCQRCRPDLPGLAVRHGAVVAQACRDIAASLEPLGLAELARRAGMSRHHFQRIFKAVTGLTPRAYGAACRAGRLRENLAAGAGVTTALFAAGYAATSRFYENADGVLGMTASQYRAGGPGEVIRFAIGQCSLGAILVARSARGVCAIALGDEPEALLLELQERFPRAVLLGGEGDFEDWVARVVGWVEAPARGLDLPLDLRGTAFQHRVWRALQAIPPGSTATYTDIAQAIGAPRAVRAVASACAANPLAVAIPCHRVVRVDGGLAGYRWGVARKQTLLAREAGDQGAKQ